MVVEVAAVVVALVATAAPTEGTREKLESIVWS